MGYITINPHSGPSVLAGIRSFLQLIGTPPNSSHPYKGCFVLLPNQYGIYHNQPPFRAQCPRWHSFLSPINRDPTKFTSRSFLQLIGIPPNSPPFGAERPYWHTTSCLPPFGEQPPRWHTTSCLPPFGEEPPRWHTTSCLPPFGEQPYRWLTTQAHN